MSIAEATKIANFAGGGGGITLTWNPIKGNSPIAEYVDSQLVYLFEVGGTGIVEALIKLPENRISTKQVKLKLAVSSSSVTDNFLLKTNSYLIRKDVDARDSVDNEYVSTNVALTNASPSNVEREIEIDITDINGKINNIAAEAGSRIRVQLYRGSDTDSADSIFTPDLTEVTL